MSHVELRIRLGVLRNVLAVLAIIVLTAATVIIAIILPDDEEFIDYSTEDYLTLILALGGPAVAATVGLLVAALLIHALSLYSEARAEDIERLLDALEDDEPIAMPPPPAS